MNPTRCALSTPLFAAALLCAGCFPQLPPEVDDDTAAPQDTATVPADTATAPDTAEADTPPTGLAPTVTAREPAPNAVAAPRTGPIVIAFDQAMELPDPSELVVQSLLVGRVEGEVTVDDPQRLVFSPTRRLVAGDEVQVSVTGLVRSLGGQLFGAPETWRFRTATEPGRGSPTRLPAIDSTGWDFAAGDLDGDGLLDLVTVSGPAGTGVRAIMQRTDGLDATSVPIDLQIPATAVALADLDGDGDLDLVALTDRAVILYNNGDATFAAGPRLPSGSAPAGLALADFDGDGRLGFAVVNDTCCDGDAELFVYTTGFGGFTQRVYPIADGSVAVAAGDLDGDGHVDLVVLGGADERVRVFINDGAGDFAGPVEHDLIGPGRHLALGDVDGDGALDVIALVTTGEVASIALLKNVGDGALSSAGVVNLGAVARRVLLVDLDGDGDVDPFAIGSRGVLRVDNGVPPAR